MFTILFCCRHSDEELEADIGNEPVMAMSINDIAGDESQGKSTGGTQFQTTPVWFMTPGATSQHHPLHHPPGLPGVSTEPLVYPDIMSPAYILSQPYTNGTGQPYVNDGSQSYVNGHVQVMPPVTSVNRVQNDVPEPYDPDLKLSDNPNYYHINGVLYYAHMEKLHRLNTGSGPHFMQ